MKEVLCRAFCADLRVVEVPVGLAVSHRSWEFGGDPMCIYLIGPDKAGRWRIQDDGVTVPLILATGTDLALPARAEVFHGLLTSHAARYQEDTGEIITDSIAEDAIPQAALRFFNMLTRVQELALLAKERVEAIWVQEVEQALERLLLDKASIDRSSPLNDDLAEYPADLVIRAAGRMPVAVYFGLTDGRAYEALLLRVQAKYHYGLDAPVILMLEDDSSISRRQRLRADANLIVPRYRGAERDAIGRIVEEATGRRPDFGALH